jgi:hypothetical protein
VLTPGSGEPATVAVHHPQRARTPNRAARAELRLWATLARLSPRKHTTRRRKP